MKKARNRPVRKRMGDFLYTLASVGVSRCLRPPWGYKSVVTEQLRNRIQINMARFEALTAVLPTTRVFWDVPPSVRANSSPLILAHRDNVIPLKMRIFAATVFNIRLPAVHFVVFYLSFVCVFILNKTHNRFKSLSFPPFFIIFLCPILYVLHCSWNNVVK